MFVDLKNLFTCFKAIASQLGPEVGVSQNSSQVSQVSQVAQFALRTMPFFSALAQFALRSMPFFQRLRNLRCALCLFFSARAICVCESINLIFIALSLRIFFQNAQSQNNL